MYYPHVPPSKRRRRRSLADWLTSDLVIYGLLATGVLGGIAAALLLLLNWGSGPSAPPTPVMWNNTPIPTPPLPPPWDGKERINVLLLGVDDRPWDSQWGAPRTDTIIVLTLDPKSMTAGAISLPRDLWVEVPGFGYKKINQAYQLGEAYLGEGEGAKLAMQVVSNLLEIPIHHYVVVNFQSFIAFVDAIHGVKIDVPQRMALEVYTPDGQHHPYPLYPGRQVLDGAQALAYARNRSVGYDGDFGRMKRQQQVLEAVLERLKDPRVLAELTIKAPRLVEQLGDSLKTDISVKDALRLARLAAEVPRQNIRYAVIDERQAPAQFVVEQGQRVYALIPNREAILAVRDEVFSTQPGATALPTPMPVASQPGSKPPSTPIPRPTQPQATPVPTPTPLPPGLAEALAENPNILVLNGTQITGLACRTKTWLQQMGFQNVRDGNADELTDRLLLMEYTAKPHTLSFLELLFGVSQSQVLYISSDDPPADIVVVLGPEWANSNALANITCSQP